MSPSFLKQKPLILTDKEYIFLYCKINDDKDKDYLLDGKNSIDNDISEAGGHLGVHLSGQRGSKNDDFSKSFYSS